MIALFDLLKKNTFTIFLLSSLNPYKQEVPTFTRPKIKSNDNKIFKQINYLMRKKPFRKAHHFYFKIEVLHMTITQSANLLC